MSATMVFDKEANVLIALHSEASPSQDEWESWMRRMAQHDYTTVLVITEGGGPNGAQRAATTKFWEEKVWPKFAFVTASALVRAMLVAFMWLGFSHYRAFAPDHLIDALRFLEVPEADIPRMIEVVSRLRRRLRERGGPRHSAAHA